VIIKRLAPGRFHVVAVIGDTLVSRIVAADSEAEAGAKVRQ
jgi:hypothetical protein